MEKENQDKFINKTEHMEQSEQVPDDSNDCIKPAKGYPHLITRIWLGFCSVLAIILIWLLALGYSPYDNQQPSSNQESAYQSLLNSHNIQKITYQDFFEDVDDKESGVYFLGYEGCPWCEDALPIAIDIAKEKDVKLHYMNTKGLKNDTQNSNQMKEILTECCDPNDGKLYYPLLVSLKDGKVSQYYIGTSEGYDPNEREMNEKEIKQLIKDYKEVFDGAK